MDGRTRVFRDQVVLVKVVGNTVLAELVDRTGNEPVLERANIASILNEPAAADEAMRRR